MYYLIFNETNAMSLHHLIAIYNEYVLDQQCANCHKEILYFSNYYFVYSSKYGTNIQIIFIYNNEKKFF